MNLLCGIVFILLLSSSLGEVIEWKASDLAKIINESEEIKPGYTFIFDELGFLTLNHRIKVNEIIKKICDQREVYTYIFLIGKMDLNSCLSDIELFSVKLREEIKVPSDLDKEKMLLIVIDFEHRLFSIQVGEKENKNMSNKDAANIIHAGTSSFKQYAYSKGVYEIIEELNDFYFSFPTKTFIFLNIVWTFIFALFFKRYYLDSEDILKMPYWFFTEDERHKLDIIADFFVKIKNNPELLDSHCLLCFHPLQKNTAEITVTDDTPNDIRNQMITEHQNSNSITVCDFQHALHFDCLDKWQKAANSSECPICLQEISKDLVVGKNYFDCTIRERLLSLQYDMIPNIGKLRYIYYSDWNEWTYSYDNEKIVKKVPELKRIEQERLKKEQEDREKAQQRKKKEEEEAMKKEKEIEEMINREDEKREKDPNYIPISDYYKYYYQPRRYNGSTFHFRFGPPPHHPSHSHNSPPHSSHGPVFSGYSGPKYGGFGGGRSGGASGGW